MPEIVTARDICERALRKIGVYSIYDTAAQPEHVDESLFWLSMVIDHVSATKRMFWLVPDTLTVELSTAGVQEYDLAAAVGPDVPDTGIQFPVSATYKPTAGDRRPVKILRRIEWEERTNSTDTGEPEAIYISREPTPRLFAHPIPDVSSYVIDLVVQRFAPDYSKDGAKGTEFRRAWNLWAVVALAAQLAAGPITRLPDGEVQDIRAEAKMLQDELEAYDLHEQADEPRQSAYNNAW